MAKLIAAMVLFTALGAGAAGMKKYQGRVNRFDPKTGKIHLTLVDHSSGDWTVLPQAKVFRDSKPAGRGAIRPGEEIEVDVSEDGNVHTVWLVPDIWGKPFEGGKLRRWDGRVVGLQKRPPGITFEVQQMSGKSRMKFTANAKTRVVFSPLQAQQTPGTLQDVKNGQTVLVLLSTADKQVTEVMIRE